MRRRRSNVLLVLLMLTVPRAAAAGATGEPVSAADRALVVKQLQLEEIDPEKDLEITKLDLNDDKHPDYVVVCRSSAYCGSGGCGAWALMSDGDRHRNVLDVLAFGLSVADTRTRGVRDLSWDARGASKAIRLIWNGKIYERADGKK